MLLHYTLQTQSAKRDHLTVEENLVALHESLLLVAREMEDAPTTSSFR